MILPLTMLVYNNLKNSTIRFASNKLLIGREPPATPSQLIGIQNPLAEQRVEQLRQWQILAMKALNNAAHGARPIEA
jgi:hypothetical protein